MRRHRLSWSWLLFGVVGPFCSAQVIAAKSPVEIAQATKGPAEIGIVLKQHFGHVETFTFHLTPTAARVDEDHHDYYVISHAPDWQVYVIRPKVRQMAVVSHRDWCQKYTMHLLSWTATLKRPRAIVRSINNGQKQIKYVFGATEIMAASLPMRGTYEPKKDNSKANHAEIVCLDYPGCAMTGPVMGRIRGLPAVEGVILSAERIVGKASVAGAMTTDGLKENVPIARSLFVPPADYRVVPFTLEMLQTTGVNENTRSLLKDFMTP